MKGLLKWTVIIVAIVIVGVIAALLITPQFIDTAEFKAPIEQYVSDATGRPVSIGDDIELSLFPWAGVSFSDLEIGNTEGFDDSKFLSVKAAEVRIKLLPLLSLRVLIDRIIINEPHISLVTDKNGEVNWNFSKETAQPETSDRSGTKDTSRLPIASLLVEKIRVTNAVVTITDQRNDTRREISGLNLALDDLSFDRPIGVSFSAIVDDIPTSIEGEIGPIGDLPGKGAILVNLQITALNQLKVQVNGTVENALENPAVDIALEVAEFSPRLLAQELGQELPATSDSGVLNRLSLIAHVKGGTDSVVISDGILVLDDSSMNFTARARDFDKPDLGFDLSLDRINLDRYLPPTEDDTQEKSSQASTKTSSQKTDYAPLRKLVLDGTVSIGELIVNKTKIDSTKFVITARDGIVRLDPLTIALYQGTVVGTAAINVKGNSPTTKVQLAVDKLQVAPLLRDALEKDFLEGALQAQINMTMRGDDAASIKQSLNGSGDLNVTDGAIIGVDLNAIISDPKSALSSSQEPETKARTTISELTAPFTMKNGLFRTTGTSIKSDRFNLLATGTADLVTEKLNFLLDSTLVKTKVRKDGTTKVRTRKAIPVKVTGTFDKPTFSADMQGLGRDQLFRALEDDDPTSTKSQLGDLLKGFLSGDK
jgi:AsmA protein